jgi:hypothetical protein
MPEKSCIFICKGVSVERLHPGIEPISKFRFKDEIFMRKSDIRKTCKEIIRLSKRVITLEPGHTGGRDLVDIPDRKPVSIMIIIDDRGSVMDLEKGVELVGEKGRGEEETENDWETG